MDLGLEWLQNLEDSSLQEEELKVVKQYQHKN